jgi:hypothetical protein
MERVRRQDGRHPTPEETFLWATRHGYAALGMADGGWLAPGNKADLIVIDLRRAHLVPLLRVVSSFVHQGQARDVEAVMLDGRWLMRNGALLTMDQAAIVREADRIGRAAGSLEFRDHALVDHPQVFQLQLVGKLTAVVHLVQNLRQVQLLRQLLQPLHHDLRGAVDHFVA